MSPIRHIYRQTRDIFFVACSTQAPTVDVGRERSRKHVFNKSSDDVSLIMNLLNLPLTNSAVLKKLTGEDDDNDASTLGDSKENLGDGETTTSGKKQQKKGKHNVKAVMRDKIQCLLASEVVARGAGDSASEPARSPGRKDHGKAAAGLCK